MLNFVLTCLLSLHEFIKILLKLLNVSLSQTGKLGVFRRDLGGATAVKSKGRGEKSSPRNFRGQKATAADNATKDKSFGGKKLPPIILQILVLIMLHFSIRIFF